MATRSDLLSILLALVAGTAVGSEPASPLLALEAYIVEPTGWDELTCYEFDSDTCEESDPALRVRYRVVEAIHGAGWPGERTLELSFAASGYATQTTRQLLVLEPSGRVVASVSIDAVAGGGWAYCGTPEGFEREDMALVQPIEFAGTFAHVGRLSEHGREFWNRDEYVVDGDVVRCRRGVPAGALLRWIEQGGRP
jgi:hypothetical protein